MCEQPESMGDIDLKTSWLGATTQAGLWGPPMWNIGIDVGGTFTDLFAYNRSTGESRTGKLLTTRPDRSIGVINAIVSAGIEFDRIELLVHGSTTATNSLVERTYPKAALICTRGFRDVIEIGRQRREELFNPYWQRPAPLIERSDRHTVGGRLNASGDEIEPLDEREIRVLAAELRRQGVMSVGICFINSYVNGLHETRAAQILADVHPECFVALSHEVSPKMREHARFSTTTIRTVLLPVMQQYFDYLTSALSSRSFIGTLRILKSNGGMMNVELARNAPEELVESGPAGGVAYAKFLSQRTGYKNIIHTDMGGTTFDASIVEDGEGLITQDYELEWEMPISIPMLDIRSVGTGGGSIAWIDAGGSLRVGPRSAGSTPGPACYGLGGKEPTLTDANLLLGRLNPTLSGKFALDKDAAEGAIRRVADPLGYSPVKAAEAITKICSENMAQAIKLVLLDRGRDPRDFVLASFGGAGALHAMEIARIMNIPEVVLPTYAGVASAFGAVFMPCRHDLQAFFFGELENVDLGAMEKMYQELESRGRELLAKDGVDVARMTFKRSANIRYIGQSFEVLTPIKSDILRQGKRDAIKSAFDHAHKTEHGVCSPTFKAEIVGIGLTATGDFGCPDLQPERMKQHAEVKMASRPIFFDGEWLETPVYEGIQLYDGVVVEGPAIIEYPHSCAVLFPENVGRMSSSGDFVISLEKTA